MSEKERDPTVVNLYALDEEWQIFPKEYKDAMDDVGEISDELSRKTTYFKYLRGKAYVEFSTGKRVVKDASDKVVAKPTGPQITALVDSDKELYEIQKEIADLEKKLSIAKSFSEAMRQKKYSLENEVKLYLSGYFSEPSTKGIEGGDNYRKELEEIQNKNEGSSQRKELKRRRRERKQE